MGISLLSWVCESLACSSQKARGEEGEGEQREETAEASQERACKVADLKTFSPAASLDWLGCVQQTGPDFHGFHSLQPLFQESVLPEEAASSRQVGLSLLP